MTHTPGPSTDPCQPAIYTIRVRGRLDAHWAGWFDDLAITPEPNGTTLLTGPVTDQAALHGLLARVRDLGLELLSVMEIGRAPVSGHDATTQ